jgi:hypothetical protein
MQKTFCLFLVFSYLLEKHKGGNYYYYYSPTPLGGPRATEGRICDASESKAGHAWIQRAPIRSSIRPILHPILSTSSFATNSGKCDRALIKGRPGPSVDPISSRGVNTMLEKLHCQRQ